MASPRAAGSPPLVAIPGTEPHELCSRHTGRPHDISIGRPEGYHDTHGRYPVIYVLDGRWDFKLVMSVQGALRFDRFTPDAIVVGIAAGGDDPDHEALRVFDYTPSTAADPGDAEGFLAFLSKQLIPFVEGRYRIARDDRTLVGSSRGRLFVLYAMFTKPQLFHRLVAVSPAILVNEEAVTAWEERFARDHADLPLRLYLAAGELEPSLQFLDPLDRLVDRLRGRRHRGLHLTHVVISGERHCGATAEAFTRGCDGCSPSRPSSCRFQHFGATPVSIDRMTPIGCRAGRRCKICHTSRFGSKMNISSFMADPGSPWERDW